MIELLASHIVEHDPTAVLWRTQDTVRYIQAEWRKEHTESIGEDALYLFLCDEHCGDLTEEEKGPRPPMPRRSAECLWRGGVASAAVRGNAAAKYGVGLSDLPQDI